MMGRMKSDRGQLFYEFHLSDAVPEDHLVRKIDVALDLSWLRSELIPERVSGVGRYRPHGLNMIGSLKVPTNGWSA